MLLINTQEKFSAVPEKWVWTFRGFEGTWSWESTKLSLIHKWFKRYWLLRNHGFHSQIGWDFLGHDSNYTADLRSSKVSENASITARYFESPNISSDCISPCLLWSSSLDLFSGVTLFFDVIKLLSQCAIRFFATCFAYSYFICEKHIQAQNLIRPCTRSIRRNSLLSRRINFGPTIRCQTNLIPKCIHRLFFIFCNKMEENSSENIPRETIRTRTSGPFRHVHTTPESVTCKYRLFIQRISLNAAAILLWFIGVA
jgi:hypothetical protein